MKILSYVELLDFIKKDILDIDFLIEQLVLHCRLYYGKHEPILLDHQYDEIENFVFKKDATNDFFKHPRSSWVNDSPFEKAKHNIPMVSLDNVHTFQEIEKFVNKFGVKEVMMEDKADGFSVELIYENGKLKQGISRGNGVEGEDLTRNVVKMKNVKLEVSPSIESLRGEIVLKQDDFEEVNKTRPDGKKYANKRNAIGIVRHLDGRNNEKLSILYYDIISDDNFKTEEEKMEAIRVKYGLETVNYTNVSIDKLEEFFKDYEENKRSILDYEIDGMVVKINDLEIQRKYDNGFDNPLTQKAWKFKSLEEETIVLDIIWQVGKGRRITPVAILQPVPIGGVTVSRATVHNVDKFNELKLFKGCRVIVGRRCDVTPYVEKNLDEE